jgi:hypothetical protein
MGGWSWDDCDGVVVVVVVLRILLLALPCPPPTELNGGRWWTNEREKGKVGAALSVASMAKDLRGGGERRAH